MTFERAGGVPMNEPAVQPGAAVAGDGDPVLGVPPALRLQILAAEHWSLLATRSLAWNDVFSRAGMFLSALSGAIVALALVGQGSGFGNTFALFGIVILPVVLFLGVTTFVRLGESNRNDALCVIGMNRIRAGYLELAPDLAKYFVTSAHDDARGVGITMGSRPGRPRPMHLLAATPVVVAVVNSVIAGAIAGLVIGEAGLATALAVVASIVVFLAVFGIHMAFGRAGVLRAMGSLAPIFPSPPEGESTEYPAFDS